MHFFTTHRRFILSYALAFCIPVFILLTILLLKGIWYGSDTTILASDGFHQYVIFYQTLRNILHGDGSFFYTFTSGLGLNFYTLSAYYLGSFLSPFVYFFDVQTMPDAVYFFTLIKFGLIGLSTYFSLSKRYKLLSLPILLSLSTSLSLMSFATSQLEINSWIDIFILIPLIMLGVHQIVQKQGGILYFISLTALFIQNYYFGYMTAIFLIGWIFVEISWNVKQGIKQIPQFLFLSLLAALTSLITLFPVYLDLKTHGETFTKILTLQTENSWYLDLFAKNLVGNFDTTKFGSLPMIYVGLLPLLLTLLFFTLKSIKWQVKMSYLFLFLFLIASFYLQPLDLFWQGMHAPNMFLHRYAWIFSVIVIFTAAETLVRLTEIRIFHFLFVFFILCGGFVCTYLFKDRYPFLGNIHFILSFEFLFAYASLFLFRLKNHIHSRIFTYLTLAFVLFEVGIHTYYEIEGVAFEWNFPSRSNYEQNLTAIDNLIATTEDNNSLFYRTERIHTQTGNDSMKFNYFGISQFSSIRNRTSSSTLDQLGFRSDGTNLNLRYQNNTILADSIFGIRYNLSETNPEKFGFTKKETIDNMSLYENQYAGQLAMLTTGVYKDVTFTDSTLENQTAFLNRITGLQKVYYTNLPINSSENASELDSRTTINAAEGEDSAIVHYTLHVPENSQVYVQLPHLTFSNTNNKNVQLIVNATSTNFTLDNTFPLFNAGYVQNETDLTISIRFPHNEQVSFDTPQFYRLDTQAYADAMKVIQEKTASTSVQANRVTTHYTTESDASLLFTIPYDKGWTATNENGDPLLISRAQNGLMKVDIPKGSSSVTLTFLPQGFITGCLSFVSGISLFLLYLFYKKRKNRI